MQLIQFKSVSLLIELFNGHASLIEKTFYAILLKWIFNVIFNNLRKPFHICVSIKY